MPNETNGNRAKELLLQKYRSLCLEPEARLPQKSDFTDEEVCFIKQSLGPWPRALEKAGLKPESRHTTHGRTLEKRKCARARQKDIGNGAQ